MSDNEPDPTFGTKTVVLKPSDSVFVKLSQSVKQHNNLGQLEIPCHPFSAATPEVKEVRYCYEHEYFISINDWKDLQEVVYERGVTSFHLKVGLATLQKYKI